MERYKTVKLQTRHNIKCTDDFVDPEILVEFHQICSKFIDDELIIEGMCDLVGYLMCKPLIIDDFFINCNVIDRVCSNLDKPDSIQLLMLLSSYESGHVIRRINRNDVYCALLDSYSSADANVSVPSLATISNIASTSENFRNLTWDIFHIDSIWSILESSDYESSIRVAASTVISSYARFPLESSYCHEMVKRIVENIGKCFDDDMCTELFCTLSYVDSYYPNCFKDSYEFGFFKNIDPDKLSNDCCSTAFYLKYCGIAFGKGMFKICVQDLLKILQEGDEMVMGNGIWLLWLVVTESDEDKQTAIDNGALQLIGEIIKKGTTREKEIALCLFSELIKVLSDQMLYEVLSDEIIETIIDILSGTERDNIIDKNFKDIIYRSLNYEIVIHQNKVRDIIFTDPYHETVIRIIPECFVLNI